VLSDVGLPCPPAGVCVHGRHVSSCADIGIAETVILAHDRRPDTDQHNPETSVNMVCTRSSHYYTTHQFTITVANNTQVYIPSRHPIPRWIRHRQCPPVAFPQTELARWSESNNTHKLAYQVVSTRQSAQDGLVVARKGLTVCP
jgi:hypothetical protein